MFPMFFQSLRFVKAAKPSAYYPKEHMRKPLCLLCSFYLKNHAQPLCSYVLIIYKRKDFLAGGLGGFGEGDVVEVDVFLGLVELGEDALADGAGFRGRTLGDEYHNLTKLLIRTLTYNKRYAHVRTQLAFEFLRLYLQSAGTDHIILSPEDAEGHTPTLPEGSKFGDVVGDEGFSTNLGGIDDQTTLVGEGQMDRGEGGVPLRSLWTADATEGDMREGLRHAIGAPDSIRELSKFCFHRLVDGSASNDEVLYLHQTLALLWYLEGVVDLERDHGGEVWNVECGMWNVEGGMWNVECGMWKVGGGMWKVEGGMWKVGGGRWNVGGGTEGGGGEGVTGGGDGEEGQVTLEGAHDHHLASDIVE